MKSFLLGRFGLTGLGALVGLMLAATAPALAQFQNQQFAKIELSAPIVNAFLSSMPAIGALADKYESTAPQGGGPLGSLRGLANSAAAQADLNATVRPYGFGDYKTWITVAQNVMSTFVFVKMGDMQQRMSGAMAAIQNNPQLSAEQKAALAARMGQAGAGAAANRPSDNNIAVVSGLMSEIATTMDAMGDG